MVIQKRPSFAATSNVSRLPSGTVTTMDEIEDARQLLGAVESLLKVWNAQASRLREAEFRRELGAIFDLLEGRRARLRELSLEADAIHAVMPPDEAESLI